MKISHKIQASSLAGMCVFSSKGLDWLLRRFCKTASAGFGDHCGLLLKSFSSLVNPNQALVNSVGTCGGNLAVDQFICRLKTGKNLNEMLCVYLYDQSPHGKDIMCVIICTAQYLSFNFFPH